MPYSKDPEAYPAEFLVLFKRGCETPITIPCDTQAKAFSFRHKLHAYRRALMHAGSPYHAMTMNCECSVEGNNVVVKPAGQAVRNALAAAGVDVEAELADTLIKPEDDEALNELFQRLGGINAGNNPE